MTTAPSALFVAADLLAAPAGPPPLHADPAVAAALGECVAALAGYRARTGVVSALVYRDAGGAVVRAQSNGVPVPDVVPDACLLANVTGGLVSRPPILPLPVRMVD